MPFNKAVTESELRGMRIPLDAKEFVLDEETYITREARVYLAERGITLIEKSKEIKFSEEKCEYGSMTANPVKGGYIDFETGKALKEKPETMTHLFANRLVGKDHPRIFFRGEMDCLLAEILDVLLIAVDEGEKEVFEGLMDLSRLGSKILAAEVRNETLEEICLLGLNDNEIRYRSHNVKEFFGIEHPIPDYKMGKLCVKLNLLRTKIRKCELCAVKAFPEREDVIKALNRSSSFVYLLFCTVIAKNLGRRE